MSRTGQRSRLKPNSRSKRPVMSPWRRIRSTSPLSRNCCAFGGTFDPIHHGHLIIAREALETLGPDEVIFVPARVSPFKKTTPVASGEIRLSMLRAAIENEIGFAVDDCELRRPAPSYTIDTVKGIRRRKSDAEIYCLI